MSCNVVADIIVPNRKNNHNSWRKKRLESNLISCRYHCWFIIGTIISLDYYASTIVILKASSFSTSTNDPLRHHHEQDSRSSIIFTKRGIEPCFLQKKSDVSIATEDETSIATEDNYYSKRDRRYGIPSKRKRKRHKDVLTFGAHISYTSDPSPLPSTDTDDSGAKTLAQFFQCNHDILLRGGQEKGAYPIQKLAISSTRGRQLIRRWRNQCTAVNAQAPDPDCGDYAASVETAGVFLGGIEIFPTSVIGVKILSAGGEMEGVDGDFEGVGTAMPEFQGVLISNEQRAKGPRPFVWLFDKIVHAKKKDDGDDQRETTSLVRVWVEPSDGSFVFRATTFLEMKIFYPRALSKLLPVGKGTAEKLCGDAIGRALEKNLFPAMEQFHRTYGEWVTEKGH